MKKILIMTLALGALTFNSCKKCQTCTTKTTQDVGFIPITTSVSEEYCGDDYDNAPPETSVSQNVGGISQTVEITCVDS